MSGTKLDILVCFVGGQAVREDPGRWIIGGPVWDLERDVFQLGLNCIHVLNCYYKYHPYCTLIDSTFVLVVLFSYVLKVLELRDLYIVRPCVRPSGNPWLSKNDTFSS